jgi:polyphenol oxidase
MSQTLHTVSVPPLETIPGLVHGFERRLGPPGWETREAGRRRVGMALSTLGRLFFLRQVHSATILKAPWEGTPEGDAATANGPGLLLAIETADCLPILVVDPPRRAVAAVHAGWRGTAKGIARRAVETMVDSGSRPLDLLVAIGPGIGPCCYEVGDELRASFGRGGEEFFRTGRSGRPHLDLRAANKAQLLEAGIPAGQTYDIDDCTHCQADLYHSYRREGQGGGRMTSYVGWALPGPE